MIMYGRIKRSARHKALDSHYAGLLSFHHYVINITTPIGDILMWKQRACGMRSRRFLEPPIYGFYWDFEGCESEKGTSLVWILFQKDWKGSFVLKKFDPAYRKLSTILWMKAKKLESIQLWSWSIGNPSSTVLDEFPLTFLIHSQVSFCRGGSQFKWIKLLKRCPFCSFWDGKGTKKLLLSNLYWNFCDNYDDVDVHSRIW